VRLPHNKPALFLCSVIDIEKKSGITGSAAGRRCGLLLIVLETVQVASRLDGVVGKQPPSNICAVRPVKACTLDGGLCIDFRLFIEGYMLLVQVLIDVDYVALERPAPHSLSS